MMQKELCPTCWGLRDTIVSISQRKVLNGRGRFKMIPVKNYHCRQCNTYIFSEDIPEDSYPAPERPNSSA